VTEEKEKASQPNLLQLSDPRFKRVTLLKAKVFGLEEDKTEFQQTLRADLVLKKAPTLSLENTLFDFFRLTNIIEYKGQTDQFDKYEFIKNEVRVRLYCLEQRTVQFEQVLNIIVCAREPEGFLEFAKAQGYEFKPATPEREWLLVAKVGFFEVAIVICRKLPLDEKYYDWLVFAPANSPVWKRAVRKFILENNKRMLYIAEDLRPKEFAMVGKAVKDEVLQQIHEEFMTPEIREYLRNNPVEMANRVEGVKIQLAELAAESQENLADVLEVLDPQQRIAGLKPEERLSGLKPEERETLLKLLIQQNTESDKEK
jgi:hypothetical protein